MGVGYFSAAEGIVGDSVLHVIEENLTAAELKHASLRQIAEESIHMDSLLHIEENPDLWTSEFQTELTSFMREGVELEKEFVRGCLPEDMVGLRQADLLDYVDFNADRRLSSLGLPRLSTLKVNPFAWLDEVIFLRKEKNFFETRVTEYQTSGSVKNTSEEDLI
jgi:ribonucleotide reductase beta subunit family protein with ferritin-like domain